MGTSDGTARSGGASPKPGHFLPGGAGDILTDGDLAAARAPTASRQQPLGLGKARAVTRVDPTLQRKARPLPADPDGFGAPPPAPLAGAPVTPLAGSRRTGGHRPVGWHSPSSRNGAQYSAEPPPIKPPARQYSKAVIAGLSVLALVMVTGATIAGFKIIDSYDNVDSPMARPSVKKSEAPLPVPADPTVTVTVQPVPDLVRLRQNKLYTAGKVPNVNCKEPDIRPNSQSAILNYYKALLPCLNRAWKPIITKAGYQFRAPKVVLQSKQAPSTCTGEAESAYYCPADESIAIDWQDDLKDYKEDPLSARVWMMDTMVHEYGHHVQEMTEILTAAWSRKGWAKTEAEKLEWSRRTELQATCLGAVFLGANKKPMGFSGEKLNMWEWQTQHSGDEYNPKKVRDHGSRKSQWRWADPAFKSASPASCNTYAAAAKKVS
jgi:predicted metalloprotease